MMRNAELKLTLVSVALVWAGCASDVGKQPDGGGIPDGAAGDGGQAGQGGQGGVGGMDAGGSGTGGQDGSVRGDGGSLDDAGIGGQGWTGGPRFDGAGDTAGYPLTPGLGPDTAGECTSAPSEDTRSDTEVKDSATQCFYEGGTDIPAATVEYVVESDGQQEWVHLRVTFDPAFVDNTYGANSIGWGNRKGGPPNAHTFAELVGSDHVELKLLDGNGDLAMHFKVDYLEADQGGSCGGLGTAGVTGGDGSVIVGSAEDVLATATSLDRNLNGCGYCEGDDGELYTKDSPATDESYTPNPDTPNWDYRMTYDVWVDAEVFGDAGFGESLIEYVHASPAKHPETDTLQVDPKDCPPEWDDPYCQDGDCGNVEPPPEDGCPEGSVEHLTTEGLTCEPVTGDGGICPEGSELVYLESEGEVCVPVNDGGCPEGYIAYVTSEGAETCVSTPGDDGECPDNYLLYIMSEGEGCVPPGDDSLCPDNGSLQIYIATEGYSCSDSGPCPDGYQYYLTSEGDTCEPTPTEEDICPDGYEYYYVESEGERCAPLQDESGCPAGYRLYTDTDGQHCVPDDGDVVILE